MHANSFDMLAWDLAHAAFNPYTAANPVTVAEVAQRAKVFAHESFHCPAFEKMKEDMRALRVVRWPCLQHALAHYHHLRPTLAPSAGYAGSSFRVGSPVLHLPLTWLCVACRNTRTSWSARCEHWISGAAV